MGDVLIFCCASGPEIGIYRVSGRINQTGLVSHDFPFSESSQGGAASRAEKYRDYLVESGFVDVGLYCLGRGEEEIKRDT